MSRATRWVRRLNLTLATTALAAGGVGLVTGHGWLWLGVGVIGAVYAVRTWRILGRDAEPQP